jgi:hypothetical protein
MALEAVFAPEKRTWTPQAARRWIATSLPDKKIP